MKTKIIIELERDDQTPDEHIIHELKKFLNMNFWKGREADIKIENE